MSKKVSVIIPTFNEEKYIGHCIESLFKQKFKPAEIIIIDDGSHDGTVKKVKEYVQPKDSKVILASQKHQGPGVARNLGSTLAKGQILVFVDADMFFDENFLEILTKPISLGRAIATNSKKEQLANPDNYWAICWNVGRFASAGVFSPDYKNSMVPDPENFGTIYRAITAKAFKSVKGYSPGGDYSDDESLYDKLGVKAMIVPAIFYHRNPSSLKEVWDRAYWIGSSGSFIKRKNHFLQIVNFLPPSSIIKSIIIGARFKYHTFMLFKIFYDLAILTALLTRK